MVDESGLWAAKMIAPLADPGAEGTAFVSRTFDCDDTTGATLRITAMGLYRAFINGTRVGEDLLTPGWTVYDARHPYQTYDVGALLNEGSNRIEIWLAEGWWRGGLMWMKQLSRDIWGDRIATLAQIDGKDGPILVSDAEWASGRLPIDRSGIYLGEQHDARAETLTESHGVEEIPFDLSLLVRHETAPVVEMAPIAPVETWIDAEGRPTYDFGQNCGAVIRLSVTGSAGARIEIEHSEAMGPDRAWDNSNYRKAEAKAVYILKDGEQTWQPIFTFMGFRYARLTITGDATVTEIHSVPLSSVPERAATFSSGHELVNRLVENTVWSQRSNFIEVPTDCPQRDERMGWTGDAQVFAGTACWLADSHMFLRKYLRDVMADQREDGAIPHFSPDPTRLHDVGRGTWAGSTGWGDVIVLMPWQLYLHYGDTDVLEECMPAILRWLDYLWSISDGPIIYPHARWGQKGFSFGDWLQPVGDNRKPRPTIGDDCAATIYHYISNDTASRIADILGDTAQAERLRARAAEIKAAFEHEFVTRSGRLAHNDQTSYALAFLHGLVPEEHREAARAHFRRVVEDADCKIGTGFIGTPDLLPALSREGMHDLAGRVFLNEEVPGWLYQVKMGATTIWERWDAMGPDGTIYDPDMNSFNHYAYGAVCQWLFEGVAGLRRDPERPGFAGLIIDPVIVPDLSPVAATHDSPRGPLSAEWRIEGDTVHYTVTLPEGCTARFVAGTRANLEIDGQSASDDVTLGSGRHEVTFAA